MLNPTKRRIACLWFPNWPIQRLVLADESLRMVPVVVFRYQPGRGEFVTFRNRLARQFGIRPEMPLSEAKTYVPQNQSLQMFPVDCIVDRHELERLAIIAQQFSSQVGLEDSDHPQCLLLEITGTAHLWGGELQWSASLRKCFHNRGYRVRLGVAETVGSAWAAAHTRKAAEGFIVLSGQLDSLNQFPVEMLRLDAKTVQSFHRLGINQIGQVLSLDRKSISTRFSRDVALRIAQYLGDAEELITPCHALRIEQAVREFEYPMTDPTALQQTCRTLLRQLLERLDQRRMGIVQLAVCWKCEASADLTWTIEIGRPTLDESLLFELCEMRWERFRLVSGVVLIRFEARQVGPLGEIAESLFADHTNRSQQHVVHLVARLTGRLGSKKVTHFELTPDPVPEWQFRRHPVFKTLTSKTIQALTFELCERPLFLDRRPKPISVLKTTNANSPQVIRIQNQQIELIQTWGPERIESAWWRMSVRRDYYRVESTTGKRWWIFQRLSDGKWFLHGEIV